MENSHAKSGVSELREKPQDRARFSMYVSKSVWLRFKKSTAKVGSSAALELLMEKHLAAEAQKKGDR